MRNPALKNPNRRTVAIAMLAAGLFFAALPPAAAGPYQEGWQAYNRGDHSAAYDIWRPLADRGDAEAQLMVGLLYANGQGVGQDIAEAYMWFLIAAANGNEHAASLYEGASNLDRLLSPDEKAEAERRAAEWQPSGGN